MKHKTAELEGALLDAAVAKAEGIEVARTGNTLIDGSVDWYCVYADDEMSAYAPSIEWMLGGPIIERERITIVASTGYEPADGPLFWTAFVGAFSHYIDQPLYDGTDDNCGPTALIAAMRAYVASKLGEEIELP